MKYIGSKARHAKQILPFILENRKPEQTYVEPFCGGCNVIDKVDGKRIANDSHPYLIAMWKALQNGWLPPEEVSETLYIDVKLNSENYSPELVGYIGFNLSFSGKYWGGYCRDREKKRNYAAEAYRNITRQIPFIEGVEFCCENYQNIEIPPNSLIYCDPPYANSLSYTHPFNSGDFWLWAKEKSDEGHAVWVSEYFAPKEWESVWEKEVHNTIDLNTGAKTGVEKLFRLKKE